VLATVLAVVLALVLLPAQAALAASLTINNLPPVSYVDGGAARPSVRLGGASGPGTLTFTRYDAYGCSGGGQLIGTPLPVTGNGTSTGPDVNNNAAGRHSLKVDFSGGGSACANFNLKRRTQISVSLPKQIFDKDERIEPAATLSGATSDAGGSVTYSRWNNGSCDRGGGTMGISEVSNGRVARTFNYQDGRSGVHSYQVTYSGDDKNEQSKSPCRQYAVSGAGVTLTLPPASATASPEPSVTLENPFANDSPSISDAPALVVAKHSDDTFGVFRIVLILLVLIAVGTLVYLFVNARRNRGREEPEAEPEPEGEMPY